MRRPALALLAFLSGPAVAAPADRPVSARDFPVSGFHRISASDSSNVLVTVGGQDFSVRAEGDAERINRLRIDVRDGELRIYSGPGRGSRGWRAPVTVHVMLPALDGASVSGSGDMKIDKVGGPDFAASVDGSGNLQVAALATGRARLRVSGSGGIRAAGTVRDANVAVSGSGNAELHGLDSENVRVSVSGSGNADFGAARTADVSVSGSGNASIGGNPRCTIQKSGSGTVRCGG